MQTSRIDFRVHSERLLQDPALQSALKRGMRRFRSLRQDVVAEVPEWETLRTLAREIKTRTLKHLSFYLRLLEKRVQEAGGVVHWAQDAPEARRIVLDIARQGGVRSIVKSKSMTTEEIELNVFLEAEGIKVTESDLGEFILQISHDHPSHFVVPVVHKSKEEIGKLFQEKLGAPELKEPEQLTRFARQTLRERFLTADMGISGVNFAVAETGTIVIVENEGNARLTTTLPRIHVAVMGVEKVIPTLEDLAVMLRILPRSATGQRITSYISLLTGPRRPGERDGPDELHLVLLDNGRTRILADPEVRDALCCIRCGACLNICPVFERTGGHAYGWVYSGPIGAVITPLYRGIEVAGELPFASSLCGACVEVCPVKIDLVRLFLVMRKRAVSAGQGAGPLERLGFTVWGRATRSPFFYEILGKLGRFALRPLAVRTRPHWLPFPLSQWLQTREIPPLPGKSFRERWRNLGQRR
ncbi:MAG: LutB/LldF family L-lactate oxidation iron-sulfur protein [Armatimonadota bacterium]|nr:LutB/LldF family L-lactate oxidation iron-sulfur protein [Armatimonadota bacterium]MDR5703852.1 LutB/LldF family L-lactate oxidation iron-sulfur protein [Armatimonadota bacterium]